MARHPRVAARSELSAFLRSRRERLSPAQAGLPPTSRRRTPGLRREEVAQIAGVGVTWYMWLEQGRQIEVSAHFLEQIARALQLNDNERAHLFALAQNRPPPTVAAAQYEVTPAQWRMLETFVGPAYIATSCLDVVAWNTTFSVVVGDLGVLPSDDRNMLWLIFSSPAHRAMIPQWQDTAKAMLARFRLEHGRHLADPRFAALIERLRLASGQFRHWWEDHNVSWDNEGSKHFAAPGVGQFMLEQETFLLEAAPMMRLVVYSPADPDSQDKIMTLRTQWLARQLKTPS